MSIFVEDLKVFVEEQIVLKATVTCYRLALILILHNLRVCLHALLIARCTELNMFFRKVVVFDSQWHKSNKIMDSLWERK